MDQLVEFYQEHSIAVHVAVTLVVAALSWFLVRRYLIRVLTFTIQKTKTKWDDALVQEGVFNHLPYIAPALVLYFAAPLFPEPLVAPLQRATTAYIAINLILVINKLLNVVVRIYRTYPIAKGRPIKGYVQVVKILVFIVGGIVAVSLLLDQSPWAFLGGLGALTAVLLLIFRDTILSFVASIQIDANDMVRVGDWIEMPKYGADGDVIEIALNTVKVQNWDKTVTTIPTYKLVEDSFKNWRGMNEAGGRRIARSLMLDQRSVRFLDEELLRELEKIEILRPYLDAKRKEIAEYNAARGVDESSPLNGRRMTNIGTFRAYVVAYLKANERLRDDMTFLVRLLAPTPEGIPLQIYVFTKTTAWVEYEQIQSDIFDHLLAAVPHFGLRVFQAPTGHDVAAIAERCA